MKQVEIGEGDDVGRHRQGQQQPDFQEASAPELVGRDEPGGADPEHDDEEADAAEEERRGERRLRQDMRQEMRPDLARSPRRRQRQGYDRAQDQGGERQRSRRPGERPGAQARRRARNDVRAERGLRSGQFGGHPHRPGLQLSKPTVSTSRLAAFRLRAISARGTVSMVSGPSAVSWGSIGAPTFTGYSKLAFA